MTWWGWLLVGWVLVSLPLAALVGRTIARGRRGPRLPERRDRRGRTPDDVPDVPRPRDGQESA
ncbi:hypothetical protein ACI8AF_19495 [Blastococcus sp. SYSU D00669]